MANPKTTRSPKAATHQWLAAVVTLAPAFPLVAAATVLAAFLGPASGSRSLAVGVGSVVALALWAIAVAAVRPFALPGAWSPVWAELIDERDRLDRNVRRLIGEGASGPHITEAEDSLTRLRMTLPNRVDAYAWWVGKSYLAARRDVSSVEEALLEVAPTEDVVGDALRDSLRLADSSVPGAVQMLATINEAVERLAEDGRRGRTDGGDPTDEKLRSGQLTARKQLRRVRAALNTFRLDTVAGLLRARNQLVIALGVSAVVPYALCCAAILSGATSRTIVAGAAFYLAAATVGLLVELRRATRSEVVIENDFGLGSLRLLLTPAVAGLGGLTGAVLVPVIGAPGGSTFTTIFDLRKNTRGLLFAVVSGLATLGMVSRLQGFAQGGVVTTTQAGFRGATLSDFGAAASQVSSAVEKSVDQVIERILGRPRLSAYDGWITVTAALNGDRPKSTDYGRIILPQNARLNLTVELGPERRRDEISERMVIDGVPAPSVVPFKILADSPHLEISPFEARITVRGSELAAATFEIRSREETADGDVWFQIYQHDQLIQVVRVPITMTPT